MKNKKIKIFNLIIIIVLIILFIKILSLKNLSNKTSLDDYLFLKLLSNGSLSKENNYKENNHIEKISNEKEIKFKIDYKNIDFKTIDLSETIDKNTLVYEKIAPGTSGKFHILLDSNKHLKYKIQFNSINQKPKNLKFQALKDEKIIVEANTLEALSEKLTGYIKENEKIYITIKWYWDFENDSEEDDIQDTKDAENIKTYKFDILTYGEELA